MILFLKLDVAFFFTWPYTYVIHPGPVGHVMLTPKSLQGSLYECC